MMSFEDRLSLRPIHFLGLMVGGISAVSSMRAGSVEYIVRMRPRAVTTEKVLTPRASLSTVGAQRSVPVSPSINLAVLIPVPEGSPSFDAQARAKDIYVVFQHDHKAPPSAHKLHVYG